MRSTLMALLVTSAAMLGVSRAAWAQHATANDIADGGRAYRDSCANCHGPDGDLIAGIDFGRGIFRRPLADEDIAAIIINGIPNTPMPATPSMSPEQAAKIVAYIRSLAEDVRDPAAAGDPGRGRSIFFGKGNCTDCHAVRGVGARHGPDLSSIGQERRAVELEASLLDPGAIVQPTGRSYRVVLPNGDVVNGRLLNHDTFTVQLIDTDEKLRSFVKADLRDYGFADSPMPSYRESLSGQEIADLVSYLVSLQGQAND
jgi:cytochrome c oxidase cbb3-type subunit III